MHTVTGLAHDRQSRVAYDSESNEAGLRARSLKLAALQRTLTPPEIVGPGEGDLLLVGWGSTKGAIEEAAARLRDEGRRVSSLHLRFLQPLQPGIGEAMARFRRVLTIESNWSDSPSDEIIDGSNRRYSALAMMLRARFLVDVDCWSQVRGAPIRPGAIVDAIRSRVTS
jgi:2-oxoglutarate ferredoxin oxidoreductase subunit alpha